MQPQSLLLPEQKFSTSKVDNHWGNIITILYGKQMQDDKL